MIRDSQVTGGWFGKTLLEPQDQTEEGFLITRERERNDSSNVIGDEMERRLLKVLCPLVQYPN